MVRGLVTLMHASALICIRDRSIDDNRSGSSMKQNAESVQADRLIQEGEYDPFANRPQSVPLTSDFAAFMHMLKCAIGTGILFLPHAFRRTGYVMSFTCGLIVKCSQMLCRRKRVPMLDFAETARSAFQTGPEWIRKYAEPFGVITNVIICFVHFQAAVIYILYVATRSSRLAQVVKIAISLSVLFSFGLAYYVPISVLWPIARSKIAAKSSLYHRLAEISLRLGGVTGTRSKLSLFFSRPPALLAIAVPQMVPLLGLFSAFGMSTIMLLIPILIETSTKWTEATRTMLVKNAVIFVVWLLILVRLSFQALEKNSGFEFEIISA
ncbi:hypothetical protein DMN91_004724 [Ooceraea biroi]|uniref:Amino acid transporter transmembrane domain-containing protein n=1 Tax=Ooceraea biroi TaxID=2015173 RepID=A0A3L8DQ96_OOCBI|nr:hypothetical protein DMN91_004724 [Ooceraea biroi]